MATNKKAISTDKNRRKSEADDTALSNFSPARIKEFSAEVKTEFGKIAWPDKKHTIGSTMVVVVLVVIMGVYLGAVDLFLGKLVGFILN
ncbi:MAG: preprotein translocase subunit SecE [Proteobacteria bacterium]|nr:preprotein translocase subunit SecE [Pseudomonadota bacterium]MBU1687449.1 preprotein translocase subunit SecE [Pseudomonadota bacterium]